MDAIPVCAFSSTLIVMLIAGLISWIKGMSDKRIQQQVAVEREKFYTCGRCMKKDAYEWENSKEVGSTSEEKFLMKQYSKPLEERDWRAGTRLIKYYDVYEETYKCRYCGHIKTQRNKIFVSSEEEPIE